MDKREQEKVTGYFQEKAKALGYQVEVAYEAGKIIIQECMGEETISISLKNSGVLAECILQGSVEEKEWVDGQMEKFLTCAFASQSTTKALFDGKYEKVRDKLIIRPLRRDMVRKEIETVPHVLMGGIALVLYAEMVHQQDDYYSAKIQRRQLEEWGIGQEDALCDAMRNTVRLHGPRLYTVEDLLTWDVKNQENGRFMEEGWKINKKSIGHILTNTLEINGAVAAFYPGVADRIANELEDDFLIAFTSLHEAQVHSAKMISPEAVESSLRDTNRHCNREEEILTDSVFRYDRLTRKFACFTGNEFKEEEFWLCTPEGKTKFEW